jgi:hypothetical protein
MRERFMLSLDIVVEPSGNPVPSSTVCPDTGAGSGRKRVQSQTNVCLNKTAY